MKKIIIGFLIIVLFVLISEISLGEKIIPDEAIRLRVLANSNSEYDQNVKEKVKKELQSEVYLLLQDTNDINDARTLIKDNLNNFNITVNNVLKSENPKMTYAIDFGKHYFPDKVYKGVKYEKGYYESLLVKLGEGMGDNWWCVLFPPLCLLEAEESTEVEYKFFVQELIDKFF
jgi:stage II sporulation protein R